MLYTNITPARVAGNLFYIKAQDRSLFALGGTRIHLPGTAGPVFDTIVQPVPGGTTPFTVQCHYLFIRYAPIFDI